MNFKDLNNLYLTCPTLLCSIILFISSFILFCICCLHFAHYAQYLAHSFLFIFLILHLLSYFLLALSHRALFLWYLYPCSLFYSTSFSIYHFSCIPYYRPYISLHILLHILLHMLLRILPCNTFLSCCFSLHAICPIQRQLFYIVLAPGNFCR